jgi:hypothetical protein
VTISNPKLSVGFTYEVRVFYIGKPGICKRQGDKWVLDPKFAFKLRLERQYN